MNHSDYIYSVGYEAELKQKLASLVGIGDHNLTDYSVGELIVEAERFGVDYQETSCGIFMHPTVQEAYLYLSNTEQLA